MMWLGMFALMAYHDGHTHGQFAVFAIGYLATVIGFFILACSCVGYLLRVARQPKAEQPLKLPNWSGVASMVKEGFLASLGALLMFYLVGFACGIPLVASMAMTGFLNHKSAQAIGWLGVAAMIGFGILVYFFMMAWIVVVQPLLLVRYANTGKWRHLFSPRWAWRTASSASLW